MSGLAFQFLQIRRRGVQFGALARQHGLRLHAGHGLNYRNIAPIAQIEAMHEVNIGHSIISRAVFVGLREAVREMKRLIENACK